MRVNSHVRNATTRRGNQYGRLARTPSIASAITTPTPVIRDATPSRIQAAVEESRKPVTTVLPGMDYLVIENFVLAKEDQTVQVNSDDDNWREEFPAD